ncbi:hypothetical protein GCM10022212_13280 [Actimicrobium antarcticum]|uniref:Uncharacterized protein n=2 Tax=Actimicrobium antarcticum TaxID=1051899 RepID=A0ABP7SZI0_9BURK
MRQDKPKEDPEKYADYFREIASGYRKNINHMMVEPTICQPTPKGLTLLVEDFVARTGHALRVVDQQSSNAPQDSMVKRFESFSKTIRADVFDQARPVGVILTLGQQHACPVLFVRQNDINHVLVFDSTSGSMTRAYRAVGQFFPDCKVLLNAGTRQVDSQSCITDAFEVLCRAFTIDNLIDKINAKIIPEKVAPSQSRLRIASPAADVRNFQLFRMPEELCFTAQKTAFVTDTSGADLQMRIQDGKGRVMTLENFMRSKKSVVIDNHRGKHLGINSYLHDISIDHQMRIMKLVEQKMLEDEAGSSDTSRAFS